MFEMILLPASDTPVSSWMKGDAASVALINGLRTNGWGWAAWEWIGSYWGVSNSTKFQIPDPLDPGNKPIHIRPASQRSGLNGEMKSALFDWVTRPRGF